MSRNLLPDAPRVELARLPTPIDSLVELSRELGVEILVKRDDLTGAVLTGNKVRKLEYVLARALESDADVLVTCGGAQSNHCRATAAAARRAGLDCELFLREVDGVRFEGNLLLADLFGATIHPVSRAGYADRDALMRERAEELEARGRNAFVIPEGASDPLGSLGYVRCMQEIVEAGEEVDVLVCAVGSGGTLAGLIAGARLLGFGGRIVGVPVCDDAATFRPRIAALLEGIRREFLPDLDPRLPEDALLDGHVGGGYGIAGAEELQRIRDVAILTGLVLDPVYTNKAFGGLLELIRTGAVPPGGRVLFLHTGGLFGLFPFADRIPRTGHP